MIVAAAYDDPRAVALLADLAACYVERYGAHDLHGDDPGDFAAPDGGCLLGLEDGTAVAVGCWRRHDAATCELVRFYVAPAARGRGWGRRLRAAVMTAAREAGYDRAVGCTTAAGVVAGSGARRIPAYGPHGDLPGVRCYEVALSEKGTSMTDEDALAAALERIAAPVERVTRLEQAGADISTTTRSIA